MTGPARVGPDSGAAGRIVFALAGARFALPIEAVEGVAPPPPLARVPHAEPALLGAGHLGGRIVPIVDLARLLGRERAEGRYDGSGEILRLRVAGGSIGLWVDKIERVIGARDEPDAADAGDYRSIDPTVLLAGGLDPPGLAAVPQTPLGDVARLAAETPLRTPTPAFIMVEAGGKTVLLPRQAVQELLETVAWTPLPRAPDGFLGVGLLRGAALPVLSLAALLGPAGGATTPGGFLRIDLGGRRALVGVDRIVGLRVQSVEREAVEPLDVTASIPEELRRIVLGFSPDGAKDRPDPMSEEAAAYLAFTIAGLECAVPAECVDRIVGPQPLIRLPRAAADASGKARLSRPESAIELRGRILPVAGLRARLGAAPLPDQEPQAYLVLRDADGLGAIGIDQARRLIRLRRSEIVPAPVEEHSPVAGVVAGPDGGWLRILAPDRLWSAA